MRSLTWIVTYRDDEGIEHKANVTAPGPHSAKAHIELTKTTHRHSVQVVDVKKAVWR